MKKLMIFLLGFVLYGCSKSGVDPNPSPQPPPPPPAVKKVPVVNIELVSTTQTSATYRGYIVDSGGVKIDSRYINWSKKFLEARTKALVNGNFEYTIPLNQGDSVYAYFSAVSTNGEGKSIELQNVTQMPPLPTITLAPITNISNTSATTGGTIANSVYTILSRGVCFDTSPFPDVNDPKTSNGTGAGSFNSIISGQNPGTKIFVRGYGTLDSAGIIRSFYTATQDSFTTTQDHYLGESIFSGKAVIYKQVPGGWLFVCKQDTSSGVGTSIAVGIAWCSTAPNFISCITDQNNGLDNTLSIMNAISTPTIARSARMFSANGAIPDSISRWLPSLNEMLELWQICHNNPVLSTQISFNGDNWWGRYWTSSLPSQNGLAYWVYGNSGSSGVDTRTGGGKGKIIGFIPN